MRKVMLSMSFMCLCFIGYTQNLEKQLVGRWEMHKVIQDGNDVTAEHNPESNRFFIFKDDGTFGSGGDPYGPNSGRYFVNNLNSSLYIDSAVGHEDDSMWYIKIEGNQLKWQGFGTKWAERFVVINTKSRE